MQKIALDKVYIVICSVKHEAEYIEKAFTNLKSADEYCDYMQKTAGLYDTYFVNEMELFD